IVLYYEGDGLTRTRALEVRKMRGTDHSDYMSFFDITDEGIRTVKLEEVPAPGERPKKVEKKREGISLEQAEMAAEHIVTQHMRGRVRGLTIETSGMKKLGDIPVFKISGTVEHVARPGGFSRREVTEMRFWTVQVDARSGKILACRV
ncbi:unnamed protein product, partial [marine sediment metagenome]